ncbi:MAG: AraC family transcriptional regulator ligand-binding domain-containing protein [Parasphingorhabdus sp.]
MTPLYGHYVPCSHLAILEAFAGQQGIEIEPLLLQHGLSLDGVRAPGATMAADQYAQLLLEVDGLREDDGFWFRFGSQLDFPAYDVLGQVLLSCETLRQALHMLAKYYQLLSCGSELTCCEDGYALNLNIYRQDNIQSRMNLVRSELLSALIYNGVSKLLPDRGSKLRFEFDYSKPDYADHYHIFLNKNCVFSAEQSKIVVPSEYLEQPGIHPNPILLKILTEQCDQMLEKLTGRYSLGAQVRTVISAIPGHYPNAHSVAEKINLSTRTLNRRLKAQGTSFQQILDEVKAQKAISYLQATKMTVEEVTTEMGYSDSANFRRAFVRWTGVLPSEYRQA